VKFLPDLRGDVISGRVLAKSDGHPLINGNISITSQRANFLFQVVRTDSSGYFYSTIKPGSCVNSELIIQVLEDNSADYEIDIRDKFLSDYTPFKPSPCIIDPLLMSEIARRNIFNQIENAYFSSKPDSILVHDCNERFYGQADQVYDLSKYTRFSTVEEILRELIPEIVVTSRTKGIEMKVRDKRNKSAIFSGNPLILLDGIPIIDQNFFLTFDALKLQKIEIVQKRFFYSALQADGIISFETFEGNTQGMNIKGIVKHEYTPIQTGKIIYSPNYSKRLNGSRIPDYRVQLYWNPKLKLYTSTEVKFFTSDIEADFILELRGYRSDGKPVLFKKRITIKN
jgi:hypothetical protein